MKNFSSTLIPTVFGLVFLAPAPASAECIQDGTTVRCDGFDTDGFVSTVEGLDITVGESGIIRNILTVARRGLCPLSFPAIVTGPSSTVTNNGLILTFGVCASGIQTGANSSVTNTATIDTFDILSFGVDVGTNSSVINAGTINTRGFVSAGIFADDTSTVINRTNAVIETNGLVAPGILTQGNTTIINDGDIRTSGEGSHGIHSSGSDDGLTSITNTGSINVGGFKASGIVAGGHTVQISNTGSITGAFSGQAFPNAPEDGISVASMEASVTNTGSIVTTSDTAVGIRIVGLSSGTTSITNSGLISSTAGGVFLSGSDSTLTIVNSGEIRSGAGPTVSLDTSLKQFSFVTNSGTIRASGQTPAVLGGAGREEVVNTGTINGGVHLGAGNDLLTLQTGTTLTGSLNGGEGFDDLVLSGRGALTVRATLFEELTKLGDGAWHIHGDISLTGRTRILQGALMVNSGGSLSSQTLEVFAGTTLELGGSVSAQLANGGTLEISPGATLNGQLSLSDASVMAIDGSFSDYHGSHLLVNGTADLAGSLQIQFSEPRPIIDGTRIVALTAGSITGTFARVDLETGGFVSASPFVDGLTAGVEFSRQPYRSAAKSDNATSIASALDRQLPTAPEQATTLFSALDALSIEEASAAFETLSSSLPLVLTGLDIIGTRQAVNKLIHMPFQSGNSAKRLGTWGSIDHDSGSIDDGNRLEMSRSATHYAAAVLVPVAAETSLSIGLSKASYEARALGTHTSPATQGDSILFSASLSQKVGDWRATAGFASGSLDASYTRPNAFAGTMVQTSTYPGSARALSGQVSTILSPATFETEVRIGLTYVHIKRDAVAEAGDALTALRYAAISEKSVRGKFDAKGTFNIGALSPTIRVGLSRELAQSRLSGVATLSVLPDAPFEFTLKPEKSVWIESEIELPVYNGPGLSVLVRGGGVLNDKTGGHQIGVRAQWLW